MPDDRGLLLRDQPAQTSPQPIRPVRPCAPWGLTGHFGHSFGPSYLTIGKGQPYGEDFVPIRQRTSQQVAAIMGR